MSERVKKALENHKHGYNCAQAVVCAYCDLFGVDEKEAFKMSEAERSAPWRYLRE